MSLGLGDGELWSDKFVVSSSGESRVESPSLAEPVPGEGLRAVRNSRQRLFRIAPGVGTPDDRSLMDIPRTSSAIDERR